jgi:deazaflavin-dependent oxidoreductase (nitroreductase family)
MYMNDYNRKVIEEFRANRGKVGGPFANTPLLLLTTKGARSGKPHTTPLGYLSEGEQMLIFASYLGAPKHPAWYHNLVAHPEVTVERGDETFEARATVLEGEERERMWQKAVTAFPFLLEHQAKTSRQIPLIVLTPRERL